MSFTTQNPATLQDLQSYSYLSFQSANQLLENLVHEQKSWALASIQEKQKALTSLAKTFRENAPALAKQMALEMGKPYSQGLAEVEKSALCAEYYIQNIAEFLEPEQKTFSGQSTFVMKEPLGVIFAIMPWNFPMWQLVRFAIPAIAAGNAVLMKHSDLTAGIAILLEKIFLEAIGRKLLANAHVNHADSAAIIADSRIRGVTFTGSTRGGKQVAELAGRALKKSVLELGGSDPYLVLADADVQKAAEFSAKSRMMNGGQSCVAAKRFFVHAKVYDEFLQRFSVHLRAHRTGDPLNPETIRGPLASQKFQLQLQAQVDDLLIEKSTRLLSGGKIPSEKGAFYPATILQMESDQELWTKEFFGPVACVWKFENEEEAIRQANHSIYGLGAAIFCKDEERALRLAMKLESGMVAINDMVKSDPNLPFGGVKDSGYGRELAKYGLYEFLNLKSVTIPK